MLFGFQAINGRGSKSQLGCHYQKVYENGVKLTKKEMELYENRIFRVSSEHLISAFIKTSSIFDQIYLKSMNNQWASV
ncbi:MAG: hypothetical protein DRQ61_07890 [Gammaproteobacteria bacterium]|nr:MAG: hypothetical protein DRQ61_07890 [Gammaproteobacteria bacterium]